MSDWTVIEGDCLEAMRGMADASVDAIVTDPPYSSGGAFRGDRTADPKNKYVNPVEVVNFHPTFTGDNRDQRAYGYWCALWLSECLRIAKPGAPICLFTDWRQLPTTTDALQAGGWIWRGIVVWDKTEAARPHVGRFRAQCEYVVWGSSGVIPQRADVGCLPGVFRVAPFRGKHHIAGKPEELMRGLVRICPPGGIIVDPFAGSGTTGVACVNTGRAFIGIEREHSYCEIARRRLTDAASQPRLVGVA